MPFQHPEQTCPICGDGFIPLREGKLVCSKKCRDRKNNLKKKSTRETVFFRTPQMEENLKVLARLYQNPVLRRGVDRSVLKGFGYQFGVCTHLDENPRTGSQVLWLHHYGLELIDPQKGTYRIHHEKS
jgi:predicted nucleic acid-binding Zn ribbon protein